MTDRDALLAAILSDPADDLPRLCFADWLDENGESEQSEFIRVQVELSRWKPKRGLDRDAPIGLFGERERRFHKYGKDFNRRDELRRRERQLWDSHGSYRWFDEEWRGWVLGPSVNHRSRQSGNLARGFIYSICLSWQDWLHHHEALYWHPKQTVECPACNGRGGYDEYRGIGEWDWASCPPCESTGRIHRPFVATAQPITEVELTTWMPRVENIVRRDHGEADSFFTLLDNDERLTFTRVKCNGEPLNEWHCDRWPTITFKMP